MLQGKQADKNESIEEKEGQDKERGRATVEAGLLGICLGHPATWSGNQVVALASQLSRGSRSSPKEPLSQESQVAQCWVHRREHIQNSKSIYILV